MWSFYKRFMSWSKSFENTCSSWVTKMIKSSYNITRSFKLKLLWNVQNSWPGGIITIKIRAMRNFTRFQNVGTSVACDLRPNSHQVHTLNWELLKYSVYIYTQIFENINEEHQRCHDPDSWYNSWYEYASWKFTRCIYTFTIPHCDDVEKCEIWMISLLRIWVWNEKIRQTSFWADLQ